MVIATSIPLCSPRRPKSDHFNIFQLDSVKHSEAFEFLNMERCVILMCPNFLWGRRHFSVLCRTKRRGLIWIVWRTLSATYLSASVHVAKTHCLGCSRYELIRHSGIFGAHLLVHLRIKHRCQRRVWRSKVLGKIPDLFSWYFLYIVSNKSVLLGSYDFT